MSACRETQAALADYLVGGLAPAGQDAVEAHLAACAACAEALAELATLEDDLLALGLAAPAPVAATAPRWRWPLALAAGALLGLGLGLWRAPAPAPDVVASAPRVLHGALASGAPALGGALRAAQPAVVDLTGGSLVELRAGALADLIGPRELRLRAGGARFRVAPGAGPFDVHMPHGRVRALGTIFDVEIQETGMQKTNMAAAGAAVLIAVTAGAVLVTSDDGTQEPVRLEAGQRALATAGSITRLEAGAAAPVDSRVATLEAQARRQRARIEALEAEKVALSAKVAELERGDAHVGAAPKQPTAKGAPVAYGRWGELKGLKDVDWKATAKAALKMKDLLPKLVALMEAGKQPTPELGIEIAKANQVLARLALGISKQVPTHVMGNGEFTHPYVLGNLLAAQLDGAGEPLAPNQVDYLKRLGEGFDAAWEAQQRRYGEGTWKLSKILDEVRLKQGLMGKFRAELSPAQREALVDPALANTTQVDITSPAQMLNGVARPVKVREPGELAAKLRSVAAQELGVQATDLEAYADVFEAWRRGLKLTPTPNGRAPFIPIGDVLAAGRAQVTALQALAEQLGLDAKARARLQDAAKIYVPRLIQPGE